TNFRREEGSDAMKNLEAGAPSEHSTLRAHAACDRSADPLRGRTAGPGPRWRPGAGSQRPHERSLASHPGPSASPEWTAVPRCSVTPRRRSRPVGMAAALAGTVLMGWIVGEVLILRAREARSWVEGSYFALGLLMATFGVVMWLVDHRRRGQCTCPPAIRRTE